LWDNWGPFSLKKCVEWLLPEPALTGEVFPRTNVRLTAIRRARKIFELRIIYSVFQQQGQF